MSISTSRGRVVEGEENVPAGRQPVGSYLWGWTLYFLEYLPGLLLLASLAFLAKFLGRGGHDSYCVLYAIVLGIIVRNTLGLSSLFEPGTRIYEVFWKAGIVLLGSQMALQNFGEVGLKGLGLAGLEVLVAISATLFLGRIFGIPVPLRYLLAAGLGICGVSAIVALSSILRSDEEDTGYAVSVILLFGLLTLSFLPVLGHLLGLSDFHFGLWAGLSVDNTAEAVATGFVFSESAGRYSTIAKLCRNLFLDAALLYFVHRMVREKLAVATGSKLRAVWRHFPKFAIGMLVFSCLATFHFWTPSAVLQLNHLYRWAFLFGFAGVGLRTDLGRLRRRGFRPLTLALGIQVMTVVVMLGLVHLIF